MFISFISNAKSTPKIQNKIQKFQNNKVALAIDLSKSLIIGKNQLEFSTMKTVDNLFEFIKKNKSSLEFKFYKNFKRLCISTSNR